MEFTYGREVRFLLRGDQLVVRRERRRWHLCWRGIEVDAAHIDHALAALLDEPMGTVMPIVTRLLRGEPVLD